MKIKIINGTYGHRPEGALHPRPVAAGEVCDVPESEAMRLVKLGVAVIVAPATVATACKASESVGAGVTLPDTETPMQGLAPGDVVDIVDRHFTAESLTRMNRTDLDSLAENLGLDVSGCKTKADVIAELVKVEFDPMPPDDSEPLPQLDAEAPVV